MNRLIFGIGKISVAHATKNGKEILLLEPSRGKGMVGRKVRGRKKGIIIDIDKDATILEFNNVESVDIVIETLTEIRKILKREESNDH